jgi:manganese transport protein
MNWKKINNTNSLPEVFGTIQIPKFASFWKKLWIFSGPGLMVAVGYMDPGNWATDLEGGAKYGYTLLSVILISNLFAMLLQHLSLKLGIVTGNDLAQACKSAYSKPIVITLWILCEIAIAACDIAEVLGAAIALRLLFGLPLLIGVTITVMDVFLLLYLQNKGFRILEAIVAILILTIFCCFGFEILASKPDIVNISFGLIPKMEIVTNPNLLYLAIGILGATVMPHNLYLHSSIVQTRAIGKTIEDKKEAIKFATIDSTFSLFLAFFVNASILILAAATFHNTIHQDIVDIGDAYNLLDPLLGTKFAGILFAVALLASGQNATLTGTLAGQIVMEGFLNIQLKPWIRRLVTRLVAIIPAFIVTYLYGENGSGKLLVFSQVILSFQLSFAVIPLVMFTNDKLKMGVFANGKFLKFLAWTVSIIIICLNIYLLIRTIFS